MEGNYSKNGEDLIKKVNDPVSPKKNTRIYILVLILLLTIVGAGAFFWIENSKTNTENVPTPQTRQQRLDELYASEAIPVAASGTDPYNYGLDEGVVVADPIKGHIIFSGIQKNSDATTQAYSLDVSSTTFQSEILLPGSGFKGFVEFADREKPGDFFLSTESNGVDDQEKDGTSIQRFHAADGTFESFSSATGNYEQGIAFAPQTNRLAFTQLRIPFKSYVDLVPMGNWEIVIINPDTNTVLKTIEGANQPKWSPDGTRLLYLKPEGLFVYDFATDTQTKVVTTTKGQILATSMMDVSPDGKFLVWTIARAGVIVINEINSWEQFTLTELGRIHENDTEYYWPQFSPDSQYYVVQAIDSAKQGSTERLNPRYEIRSNLDRTVLRSFPLTSFDFNAFFTDTWIADLPVIDR